MFRYAIKEFSNKNIHHAPTVCKVVGYTFGSCVMQLVSSYKYCMIDGRASLRDTRNRETNPIHSAISYSCLFVNIHDVSHDFVVVACSASASSSSSLLASACSSSAMTS